MLKPSKSFAMFMILMMLQTKEEKTRPKHRQAMKLLFSLPTTFFTPPFDLLTTPRLVTPSSIIRLTHPLWTGSPPRLEIFGTRSTSSKCWKQTPLRFHGLAKVINFHAYRDKNWDQWLIEKMPLPMNTKKKVTKTRRRVAYCKHGQRLEDKPCSLSVQTSSSR